MRQTVSIGQLTSPAGRYAQALFGVCVHDHEEEKASTDLNSFLTLFTQEKIVRESITPGVLSKDQRLSVWQDIGQRLSFHRHVIQFVAVLIDAERLSLLPKIVEIYDRLLAQDRGIVKVLVESPQPLSKEQLVGLEEVLTQRYAGKIQIQFQENASLLGGFRVLCGSEVIDASLLHNLRNFTHTLRGEA